MLSAFSAALHKQSLQYGAENKEIYLNPYLKADFSNHGDGVDIYAPGYVKYRFYTEYYNKGLNSLNGERFVAPLYDYLLSKGGEVFISNVPKEKVHVLGTPFELETFLNS